MLLRPTRYINSAAPEFSPGQFFNACTAFCYSLLPSFARYRYREKERFFVSSVILSKPKARRRIRTPHRKD